MTQLVTDETRVEVESPAWGQPESPGDSPHRPLHPMEIQGEEDAPVVVAKKPAVEATVAKVDFLDGIRGLAVIMVVSHHAYYMDGVNAGAFGVDMFFVLSAFLLTMILDRKFRVLRAEGASWQRWGYALVDYGVKRILRVYPLFALVAFMIHFSSDKHKVQWYFVRTSTLGNDWHLFDVLTFDESFQFYILWTLPLELTYYLYIPAIVAGFLVLKRWWWIPALPTLGWIVYSGVHTYRHSSMGLKVHHTSFLSGSLAAIVYNRFADLVKKHNFQFKTWQAVLLQVFEAIIILLLVSEGFEALIFDWFGPSPFHIPKSDHFVCLHVSIIIVCEMLRPSAISKAFEWNILRYAGKISYSVYLLHPRIIHSDFIKGQQNYYTHIFSIWILVFFWCTLSYQIVERQCQRLANWIGKKIKTLDIKAKAKQHHGLYA